MIAQRARRALINLGKSLPFFVVFVVAIAYMENIIALVKEDYLYYNDGYVLNTPVSFMIGRIFKYDLLVVSLLTVLCYAIRTCVWNKIAIAYLAIQIAEREYLQQVDLLAWQAITIATANVAICAFVIIKAIIIYSRKT